MVPLKLKTKMKVSTTTLFRHLLNMIIIWTFNILGDTESYLNGSMDNDHKLVVKEELENDEECFKKALNLCTSLQNYKGK